MSNIHNFEENSFEKIEFISSNRLEIISKNIGIKVGDIIIKKSKLGTHKYFVTRVENEGNNYDVWVKLYVG